MVIEQVSSHRPLGPLVWELEENGCTLTLLSLPSVTGTLAMRVCFPEDEYLERRCRRLLEEWSAVSS